MAKKSTKAQYGKQAHWNTRDLVRNGIAVWCQGYNREKESEISSYMCISFLNIWYYINRIIKCIRPYFLILNVPSCKRGLGWTSGGIFIYFFIFFEGWGVGAWGCTWFFNMWDTGKNAVRCLHFVNFTWKWIKHEVLIYNLST